MRGGCRFGGFGGLRAAALRRDRLASPGAAPLSWLRLTPRCSAPPPSPRDGRFGGCGDFRVAALRRARLASLGTALPSSIALSPRASAAATAASAAFTPPRCAATAAPRLTPHRSVPHRLRPARRLRLRRLRRLSRRRSRLASLGAALLSTIAFVSRVGYRFRGLGGFLAAALRRARLAPLLAPHCSAPSPSALASASASAALAASAPSRCAALAAPRCGRRAAQLPHLRLARWPPLRRLRRPSRRRAAPRPPRPAWRRAAQHHLFASRVGCRLGGSGGFRAAALRRARLASLQAPRCSASPSSPRASAAASAAVVALSPPCCAALASPCLAPRCSAPSHSPRASAAALTAAAALHRRAAPRLPRLAGRRAARHHHLRLAHRPPLRQLRRLPRRRAAPRSPRPAWRRAAQHLFFPSRFSCRFGGWGSLITDAIEARALALASLAQRGTPLRSKQFTWLRKQSPR